MALEEAVKEFSAIKGRDLEYGNMALGSISQEMLDEALIKAQAMCQKIDLKGSDASILVEDSRDTSQPDLNKDLKVAAELSSPYQKQGNIGDIYRDKYESKSPDKTSPIRRKNDFSPLKNLKYDGSASALSKGSYGSPRKNAIALNNMDQDEIDEIYEKVMDIGNLSKLAGFDKSEVKELIQSTQERK